MIRVILCDDHAMVRRGIRDTLAEAVDIQVTAEASSYSEVRDAIRMHACDVLVLDINLPGRSGLEVLSSLRETDSPIKLKFLQFSSLQFAFSQPYSYRRPPSAVFFILTFVVTKIFVDFDLCF